MNFSFSYLQLAAVGAAGSLLIDAMPTAFAQVPTFASADLVLGQPDFVTKTRVFPRNASSFEGPNCVIVDPVSGKVFVSDGATDRILRFASADSLANNAEAEAVFGNVDFAGTQATAPEERLSEPDGLALDSAGRLWVADRFNNRVIMFENAVNQTFTPGTAFSADLVLGQPNFSGTGDAITAAGMDDPRAVWADAFGNLFVVDKDNHRVLLFADAASKNDGADADAVYGQTNLTSKSTGRTATEFNEPYAVMRDTAGTLWVADYNNGRVIGFETTAGPFPDLTATRVFGQSNLTGGLNGFGNTAFDRPSGVHVDRFGSLWVGVGNENRVLRFDSVATKPNGSPADAVIGQADFSSSDPGLAANRIDTERFLAQISVAADGDLWVADSNNNRVLRFSYQSAVPRDLVRPRLRIRGRKTIETLRNRVVIRGTAIDASGIADLDVRARGAKVAKAKVRTDDRFKVVLRVRKDSGRVIVKLRAEDPSGNKSKRAKFRILRR